ncbi:hypothetical protein H4Q26_009631 [Puccinia striiformis f. sp. tritici PST-130]|nr:hypothetical protein H4Q26_009631 [Puccinia striiformis f. sp. tritici PST-130]
MESFKAELMSDLHEHYDRCFGSGGALSAADIFGEEEADAIVEYLHHINHVRDVRGVIGGTHAICIRSDECNHRGPSRTGSITVDGDKPLARGSWSCPRPPTKKALAAEASRLRSIEKEKRVLSEQKRKAQWSQFLKEGLEQAQKEKDKNEQTNQAGGNRHESGHQQAANYNRPSPAGGSQDKGDRQAT